MPRTHALPLHPHTGLRAVGIVNGKAVWPILGGDDSADAAAAAAAKAAADAAGTTYTPPATQEELDRIINKAVGKYHSRYADYDSLKERAARADQLEHDLGTDTEKAVAAAKKEADEAARSTFGPSLVRQAFRAESAGKLSKEQLDALLEDYNPNNYLNLDGSVDEDKVAARVTKVAGANGGGGDGKGKGNQSQTHRDLGQGNQPPVVTKPGDQARAQLEKRFGKKQAAEK